MTTVREGVFKLWQLLPRDDNSGPQPDATAGARLGRDALRAILFASLLAALAWSYVNPLWQVPDEPAHYMVVQYVAQEHRPAFQATRDYSLETRRAMQLSDFNTMDLFSHVSHARIGAGTLGPNEARVDALPRALGRVYRYTSTASNYPPFFYSLMAIPYSLWMSESVLVRVFVVRASLAPLFVVWLALSYALVRSVLGRHRVALLATWWLATWPTALEMAGGVNPNTLDDVLAAAILLLAWIWRPPACSLLRASGFGLLVGVALLDKPQLGLLGLVVAPLWLASAARSGSKGWWQVARSAPVVLAAVALVDSWWYLEEYHRAGLAPWYSPEATGARLGLNLTQYFRLASPFYQDSFLPSLVGNFGWLSTPLPGWALSATGWMAALLAALLPLRALLGMGVAVWRDTVAPKGPSTTVASPHRSWPEWAPPPGSLYLLWAAAVWVSAFVWFDWQTARWTGMIIGLQGRFLLPVLPPLTGLAAFALLGGPWRGIWRAAAIVPAVVFSAWTLLLDAVSVGAVIHHFYPTPPQRLFEVMGQYKPPLWKELGPLDLWLAAAALLLALLVMWLELVTSPPDQVAERPPVGGQRPAQDAKPRARKLRRGQLASDAPQQRPVAYHTGSLDRPPP
jgi:hypothetical protein